MLSPLSTASKDLILEGAEELGKRLLEHCDLLKDVPVVGTAVKVATLFRAIPDALFLNKVKRFALELESVSIEDRTKFAERMMVEPETCQRAGENVLLLLDRLDDMDKATLLGRLFAGYMRGALNFEEFRRLASCVDGGLTDDFNKLLAFRGAVAEDNRPYLCYLSRTALVDVSFKLLPEKAASERNPDVGFEVTALGKLFVRVLTNNER